jgi:hypothetical protein
MQLEAILWNKASEMNAYYKDSVCLCFRLRENKQKIQAETGRLQSLHLMQIWIISVCGNLHFPRISTRTLPVSSNTTHGAINSTVRIRKEKASKQMLTVN